MSNLEDKLKRILYGDTPETMMSDSMLSKPAQIIQAFKDEGWHEPLTKETKSIWAPTIEDEQRTFMTGQEWYDRFREASKTPPVEIGSIAQEDWKPIVRWIVKAARKAAGL